MKRILLAMLLAFSFTVHGEELLVKLKQGASLNFLNAEKVTQDVYLIDSGDKNFKHVLALYRDIEHVEVNQTYTIDMGSPLPKQDLYDRLWGLHGSAGVEAEQAWEITKGSKDIIIAVIDTGVDYNHPDLKDNMWVNPDPEAEDVHGYDFVNNNGSPMDDNGHGTHCAGTIGALHDDKGISGVMANVKIMGVKFLSARGSGTTADAIRSIDYAREKGAHIMSNSWGGGGYSKLLEEAIQRANEAGIVFIAAAGNSNANNDVRDSFPANYDVDNVISVASHTQADTKSSFSSYGKTKVHVSAPGSSIMSTWINGGYRSISGTSMATPHVSGIVGLMLSADKTLTPLEVRNKLIESCIEKPAYFERVVCNGRISALKAVK